MADQKTTNQPPRRLYRRPDKGMITGVAAGLGDYFDIDVTLMRILWVVAAFATAGAAILVYFIMALLMPIQTNQAADVRENMHHIGGEIEAKGRSGTLRNYLGLGLIGLGAWLLLGQFWTQWWMIRWDLVWPAVLIIIGVVFLVRARAD